MRVLVTGANGFIGKNLIIQLRWLFKEEISIVEFTRERSDQDLSALLDGVDFVFHLAGENRPTDPKDFYLGNVGLTETLIQACREQNRAIPILFSSSTQAALENDYGVSKREAEELLQEYAKTAAVYIYRLNNIFGKWCKPNYNSVIATWCHNIANDLPISIADRAKTLDLIYIDDIVSSFISVLQDEKVEAKAQFFKVSPVYQRTLGDIADSLMAFSEQSDPAKTPAVAHGFERALYATYLSYLPQEKFQRQLIAHSDARGSFYEVFKTENSGQVSISTTKPGVTRGNHFHHTKNERFLVVKGKAIFRFRDMISDETCEITTDDTQARVIEVPVGYTHNFTNIGDDELIVLLWVNEAFQPEQPDTYFVEV